MPQNEVNLEECLGFSARVLLDKIDSYIQTYLFFPLRGYAEPEEW